MAASNQGAVVMAGGGRTTDGKPIQEGEEEEEGPPLMDRLRGAAKDFAEKLRYACRWPDYEVLLEPMCDHSLFVLSKQSSIRRGAACLVNWKPFEWLTLVVILINCVTLSMDSNAPGFSESQKGQALYLCDFVFLGYFTLELLIKILAMGLWYAPNTYLRDNWNVLDAVVVATGYLTFTSMGNLTAIRGCRALRPLRTITRIKELRVLVMTLINSLPMLLDVTILTAFYLAVFGATTLQLFQGSLRFRCGAPDFSTASTDSNTSIVTGMGYTIPSEQQDSTCNGPFSSDITWVARPQPDGSMYYSAEDVTTLSQGRTCPWQPSADYPQGLFCTEWGNPGAVMGNMEQGYRDFDNILYSWLAIFQHMTKTDWVFIMYNTQDAVSWWTWVLHVTITILGGLVLVNLVLAVLYIQFTADGAGSESGASSRGGQSGRQKREPQPNDESNHQSHHPIGLRSGDASESYFRTGSGVGKGSKGKADVSMALASVHRQVSESRPSPNRKLLVSRSAKSSSAAIANGTQALSASNGHVPGMANGGDSLQGGDPMSPGAKGKLGPSRLGAGKGRTTTEPELLLLTSSNLQTDQLIQTQLDVCLPQGIPENALPGSASVLSGLPPALSSINHAPDDEQRVSTGQPPASAPQQDPGPIAEGWEHVQGIGHWRISEGWEGIQGTGWPVAEADASQAPINPALNHSNRLTEEIAAAEANRGTGAPGLAVADGPAEWEEAQEGPKGCWQGYLYFCEDVTYSLWFEFMNAIIILCNAIVLGLNWYNMPPSLDTATSWMNYIFTVYFLFELIIRLSGQGPKQFFKEATNWFDLGITVGCLIDMIIDILPGVDSEFKGTLTALRLLRLFRLARYWASLNKLLQIMVISAKSVAYLVLLLLLFMFITGLLGMQLFGFKVAFCDQVSGSSLQCPPGMSCPSYWDCWLPCDNSQALSWFQVDGSPYGGNAYCEEFPRAYTPSDPSNPPDWPQYWANVGKPSIPRANFNDIYQSFITIFQLLTLDNWADVMEGVMQALSPWYALYFVIVIVLGSFLILQLFLAILLENLDQMDLDNDDERDPSLFKIATELLTSRNPSMVMRHMSERHAKKRRASSGGALRARRSQVMPDVSQTSGSHAYGSHVGTRASIDNSQSWRVGVSGVSRNNKVLPEPRNTEAASSFEINHARSEAGRSSSTTIPIPAQSEAGISNAALPMSPMDSSNSMAPSPFSTMHLTAPLMVRSTSKSIMRSGSQGTKGVGEPHGSVAFSETDPGIATANASVVPGEARASVLAPRKSRLVDARAQSQALQKRMANTFHRHSELTGKSLFLFDPDHVMRYTLYEIVTAKWFEYGMIFIILGSSVALTLDTVDLEKDSMQSIVLHWFDVGFAVVFWIEAILKIIVLGFAWTGPTAYIRSMWNCLDLFVAVISVLVLVLEAILSQSIIWLQALRALRGLRLLRAATKLHGVRVVWIAIIKVLPTLVNVLLVGLLFYYIFAVMSVILLMGQMYYCADASSGNMLDAYYVTQDNWNINKTWCEHQQVPDVPVSITTSWYHSSINVTVPAWNLTTSWTKTFRRFDNVFTSIYVLFQMASLESWTDIMYATMDTVGFGQQPMRNYNKYIALLFIVFIMVGALFILNLVIGVSINKFHQMKAQSSGRSPLLTPEQNQWLTIQRVMAATRLQIRYLPPNRSRFRAIVFWMIMGPVADGFFTMVILCNIVMMLLVHYNQGVGWDWAFSIANVAFTGVFFIEMALKWIAVGIPAYMADKWNVFDCVIVWLSVLGVMLDFLTPSSVTFLPLLRIFRVARIFRLIPRAKSLRTLLQTLMWSLPAVGNVACVLFLFMYVYAIIGMNFFGNVKQTDSGITRNANFLTFSTAMLTEFRMITGENWNDIMEGCMNQEDCIYVKQTGWVLLPDGTNTTYTQGAYLDPRDDALLIAAMPSDQLNDQCSPGPWIAIIYFFSFMMICSYLLTQLVIGIFLDNIQESRHMGAMAVGQDHITAFTESWEELDPKGTSFIRISDLTELLLHVPPPLGVQGLDRPHVRVQEIIMSVDIPNRSNKAQFMEVLHALAGRVAHADMPMEEEYEVISQLAKQLPKDLGKAKYMAAHVYAALAVRSAVRGFMQRRRMFSMWSMDNDTAEQAAEIALAGASEVLDSSKPSQATMRSGRSHAQFGDSRSGLATPCKSLTAEERARVQALRAQLHIGPGPLKSPGKSQSKSPSAAAGGKRDRHHVADDHDDESNQHHHKQTPGLEEGGSGLSPPISPDQRRGSAIKEMLFEAGARAAIQVEYRKAQEAGDQERMSRARESYQANFGPRLSKDKANDRSSVGNRHSIGNNPGGDQLRSGSELPARPHGPHASEPTEHPAVQAPPSGLGSLGQLADQPSEVNRGSGTLSDAGDSLARLASSGALEEHRNSGSRIMLPSLGAASGVSASQKRSSSNLAPIKGKSQSQSDAGPGAGIVGIKGHTVLRSIQEAQSLQVSGVLDPQGATAPVTGAVPEALDDGNQI